LPVGAKVVLAKPGSRETKAGGLSVAGRYVFELTVVDRTKAVTKDVVVTCVGPKVAVARDHSSRPSKP
jgi:hypothetical protein